MLLIPKIYLKNGKAVPLEKTTSPLFSEDPQEFMENLLRLGCTQFHIVDLSVPHVGASPHLSLLQDWTSKKHPLTLTGNIVTVQCIEHYLQSGINMIALQSVAYQQPHFLQEVCKTFPEKIAVHIDVKAKKVVIPGWTVVATKTAYDYVARFHDIGIKTVFYSDVDQNGNIGEDNLNRTFEFCRDSLMRVFLTSEVNKPEDISTIARLGAPRLEGLVLNKAFYFGKIDLAASLTEISDITQNLGTERTLLDEE